MSKNHNKKLSVRFFELITAYMNQMLYKSEKTLSRIAYKRSFRPKWYLDTPLFHVFLTPQANNSLNSPCSWTGHWYGILLVLLVYLRVDFYMRHPNSTGRLLREATGVYVYRGICAVRVFRRWRAKKNRLGHIVRFKFRGPTDIDLQKKGDLCLF